MSSSSPDLKRQKIDARHKIDALALAIRKSPRTEDAASSDAIRTYTVPESCLPADLEERRKLFEMTTSEVRDLVQETNAELTVRQEKMNKMANKLRQLEKEVLADEAHVERLKASGVDKSELKLRLAYLEGEERALEERHARNLAMLRRQHKRDTEACQKVTAATKMDVVAAQADLNKLKQAATVAQQTAQDLIDAEDAEEDEEAGLWE